MRDKNDALVTYCPKSIGAYKFCQWKSKPTEKPKFHDPVSAVIRI